VIREGHSLVHRLLGPKADLKQVRTEIEKVVKRGKAISTHIELPLSEESKRVLQYAVEEADRLGNRLVAIEHFLLGIARVDGSLAARIIRERGADLAILRERVVKFSRAFSADMTTPAVDAAISALHRFVASLVSNDPAEAVLLLAQDAQIVDYMGQRWRGREEIEKEFGRLFVAYSKNAASRLESIDAGPGHSFLASV
jgi:ATP-dependent Clp protease ATP-binding subunit ClpA